MVDAKCGMTDNTRFPPYPRLHQQIAAICPISQHLDVLNVCGAGDLSDQMMHESVSWQGFGCNSAK